MAQRRALRYLLGCSRLLVAYDVDVEGEKGAERPPLTLPLDKVPGCDVSAHPARG